MGDCIFCKIVEKHLPSYKVYEDHEFFAFLDINPRVRGHTLLIPKKHFQWIYDVPNFGNYWSVALKITRAMQKALQPAFVSYITHGLEIPHAHIHILPRKHETDFVPEIKHFSKSEMEKVAEKIKNEIYT